jgi:IclR family KDG regulon transcriptional repressor
MGTNGVKVLDKALFILSQFFEKDELTLKELEEISGLNRSTIYRILQAYQKWGFLEKDPATKRYKVSIKILEMTGSVLRKLSFLNVCRPYLLRLRDEAGESTFLAILKGVNIIIADWELSYFDAHINITVGKTVPAHCTGSGKAILAFLTPEEQESVISRIKLKKYTENTITDKDKFLEVLRVTRERGYGVSKEEYDMDIVVAAAPIFGIHNRVIASCAIAALKSRVKSDDQIDEYGKLVIKAASEISQKLGSTRYAVANLV